jgi:signal transduction histidine kinase
VLLAPLKGEFDELRQAVRSAVKASGFKLFSVDEALPTEIGTVLSEILRADIVIAVLSQSSSNIFYEVGLAHASGKPVIFLIDEEVNNPPLATRGIPYLRYNRSAQGLLPLRMRLRRLLEEFKRAPDRFEAHARLTSQPNVLPVVDLDRLGPREFENLCFELLTQMGFRRVEWGKQAREIDVVATLPKKDPDGFEYNELWLISMGLRFPSEILIDMAAKHPEFVWQRLLRPPVIEQFSKLFNPDTPVTLLLISFRDRLSAEALQSELRRIEQRALERRSPYALRVRVWDRRHIVRLIEHYPQIAYKYFAEERRIQSTARKSLAELYHENSELTEKLHTSISALKEERDKRVRAERDAVWKDVAFTAAHKLGNPIFALETNLQGMKRTIAERPEEALEIAAEMGVSIEKAKTIIDQFKSLTKAQEIETRAVDLVPILHSASRVAANNGVVLTMPGKQSHSHVLADPTRMSECFDELFANALHWLDKPDKRIVVKVDVPRKKELPADLTSPGKYVRIRFEDNGCGIPFEKKTEAFAPFYTTYPHGTGLGLSLVHRVIEGHEGIIREIGQPGEGAVFEIFLPQAASKGKGTVIDGQHPHS